MRSASVVPVRGMPMIRIGASAGASVTGAATKAGQLPATASTIPASRAGS